MVSIVTDFAWLAWFQRTTLFKEVTTGGDIPGTSHKLSNRFVLALLEVLKFHKVNCWMKCEHCERLWDFILIKSFSSVSGVSVGASACIKLHKAFVWQCQSSFSTVSPIMPGVRLYHSNWALKNLQSCSVAPRSTSGRDTGAGLGRTWAPACPWPPWTPWTEAEWNWSISLRTQDLPFWTDSWPHKVTICKYLAHYTVQLLGQAFFLLIFGLLLDIT